MSPRSLFTLSTILSIYESLFDSITAASSNHQHLEKGHVSLYIEEGSMYIEGQIILSTKS